MPSAPRVLILTDEQERHFYFANRLIAEVGNVVGVITGGKRVNQSLFERLCARLRPRFLPAHARNFFLDRFFYSAGRALARERHECEGRFFSGERDRFERQHGHLRIAKIAETNRSINDMQFVKLIRSLRPDMIAVMGTCLVGKEIISAAPLVLNLHAGLSPYYRGGFTNLFPFVEGDYGFFGVTVHKISWGIDSGDIVASARTEIVPEDTYSAINSRSIVLGASLMVQAIKCANGTSLPAVPQWEKGKLFNNRDFNNLIAHKYLKRRSEFIRRYLELQRRNQLPDIRMVSLPDAESSIAL